MAPNPKVKKLIDVKQHIRDGHMIHQFKRQQLVEEKTATSKKRRDYPTLDSIIPILEDAKYEFGEGNYGEWQRKILEAYTFGDKNGKDHAIQDQGFGKSTSFLFDVFDRASDHFSYYGVDSHIANDQLTNPNYLVSLWKSSLAFESHLNKNGIETERVDPFTFKSQDRADNLDLFDEINDGLVDPKKDLWNNFITDMQKDLKLTHLVDRRRNYGEQVEHGHAWLSRALNNLVIGTDLKPEVIRDKIIGPILASNILSPNHYRNLDRIQGEEAFDYDFMNYVKTSIPKELQNQGAMLEDPEKIRKGFRDVLEEMHWFTKGDEAKENDRLRMLKGFKDMKASDIPYQFAYLMDHHMFFPYMNDPTAMTHIKRMANKATLMAFDRYNDKGSIYQSNNPLEKVTMSPQGVITSCQSISKDGALGVNEYNTNLISALHNSQDFIMFTKEPTGPYKRERMSFNHDHGKINSYENFRVYHSSKVRDVSKGTINSFLDNNQPVIDMLNDVNGDTVARLAITNGFREIINIDNIPDGMMILNDQAHDYVDTIDDDFAKYVTSQSEQRQLRKAISQDWQYDFLNNIESYYDEYRDYQSPENLADLLPDAQQAAREEVYNTSSSALYDSPLSVMAINETDRTYFEHGEIRNIRNRHDHLFNRAYSHWHDVVKKYHNKIDELDEKSSKLPEDPID